MPVATKPAAKVAESVWDRVGRLLVRLFTPLFEQAMINLMRKGTEPLIALSVEEYEAYRETVEVLSDEGAMADLRASEEDERAGRLYDYDEVRAELGLGEARPHPAG